MYHLKNFVVVLLFICAIQLVVGQEYENVELQGQTQELEPQTAHNTYDYIVVGTGQGGSAATGSLAQSGARVLAIEWGDRSQRSLNGTDYVAADYSFDANGKLIVGTPFTRFDIPGFAPGISYTSYPRYPPLNVWLNGAKQTLPIGKHLGGSGAHNGMAYMRHTKHTMDSWGVPEWSWSSSLPFWKQMENASASIQRNFPQYHGFNGPIQLSDPPKDIYHDASPILLEACQNLGYQYNPDFNGPNRFGCGEMVFSIGNGVRFSAAHAYIAPAARRGNLFLAVNSRATKIHIKEGRTKHSPPVAYGVRYRQEDGTYKDVYASKEIVVSCGAIFTPQLLLLSGIGPAAELQRLNIKVWVNNPNVGTDLHATHGGVGSWTFPGAKFGVALDVGNAANQYCVNRTGPWISSGSMAQLLACSNSSCAIPNIRLGTTWGGNWAPATPNFTSLTTQIQTINPKVRGSVTLLSANPLDLVNVTLVSYAHQEDVDAMVFGYKLFRKWLSTPPAAAAFPVEVAPGPTYQTDAQLADYVKAHSKAGAHAGSTTKFGNTGDPKRVLDPQLRVVGISGLRVADAGIYPSVDDYMSASAALAGVRVAHFILSGN